MFGILDITLDYTEEGLYYALQTSDRYISHDTDYALQTRDTEMLPPMKDGKNQHVLEIIYINT